ncbi:carboxypeptidase-like regulatory domain-containing protein [Pontibacter sp. H259]|uniref:carboxypeptidase-like regulatory domain-containing protein n=1 Tax=Pontibacter sp. H259 TaxID=3133421 RepID=UPI0030C4A06C
MNKLNRLYFFSLSALLLTACEPEETATEINGKVIAIETNSPIADAKLNLTVGEGIAFSGGLSNSVYHTTTSDAGGNYRFILPENKHQKLYLVTPEKTGYVEVREPFHAAVPLKPGEKNQQDVKVAQGSFLNLHINKTPSNTEKTLKLTLSYTIATENASPSGIPLRSELIAVDAQATNATITRGFYFKHTSKISLTWEVTSKGVDSKTERFNEAIDLREHDSVDFEINY